MPTLKTLDAIRFLKADHEVLRGLLAKLVKTTERAPKKRRELLSKVSASIRAHAKVEEEIFYPAFHEACRSRGDELKFLEAAEEHGLVDVVLPALEGTSITSEVFAAKSKVLKDLIEHHAGEEEDEMFPRALTLLGKPHLLELGAQLAARHDELLGKFARRGSN